MVKKRRQLTELESIEALLRLRKVAIQTLPDPKAHRVAGHFDGGRRWWPGDGYLVPGSFQVRAPSRDYPWSYLKHFYSLKYARLLAMYRPDLYCSLQGIDAESEEAKLILAWADKAKQSGKYTTS
jgi:hypothetical protein